MPRAVDRVNALRELTHGEGVEAALDCSGIVDRRLPLTNLLTPRHDLDEGEAAYRLFDTQTTGKGVFVF